MYYYIDSLFGQTFNDLPDDYLINQGYLHDGVFELYTVRTSDAFFHLPRKMNFLYHTATIITIIYKII